MTARGVAAGLGLAVLACGGGGSDTVAPPPQPPSGGPGPATQLALVAGDGQQAIPGATLPVAPAVAVRDAQGRAVPNVTVSFTVDSGGGTLTGANAVSGGDGVARAGSWQLGGAEGRHVVSARSGSLAAVKFVASALLPDVPYAPQAVPVAGGAVTISRPGQPLDGFRITIPAGALGTAASIGLTVRSSAAAALPPGASAGTPLVLISTATTALSQPALVRIPLAVPASGFRAAAIRRPGRSTFEFIPTIQSDAQGITVALGDLGSNPAAPGAAVFGGAAAGTDNPLEVLGTFLNIVSGGGDFDTGFRPGVDDWDFARQPIANIPAASGSATLDPAQAMVGSAIWYFTKQKQGGPGLNARFQEAAGIPESNRRGLRWMGIATPGYLGVSQLSQAATVMNTEATADPAKFTLTNFQNSKAGLQNAVLGLGPVAVLLFAGTSADAPKVAVAFRRSGNVVDLAIPDAPGQTFHAEFVDATNSVIPFQVATTGGGVFTVTALGIPLPTGYPIENALATQWARVLDGTIGGQEGWPTTQLRGHVQNPKVSGDFDFDATGFMLGEQIFHWWKCAACPANPVSSDDGGKLMVWRRASRRPDGSWPALPALLYSSAGFSQADVAPALEATSGFAIYLPGPQSTAGNPAGTAWLDWKTIRYRRLPATVTPDDQSVVEETEFTFTGSAPGAPPGVKYSWRLAGDAQEQETAQPTWKKTISRPGINNVVFEVREGTTYRVIATDTAGVTLTLRPFSVTPSPISGSFDTDYLVTATLGEALPPAPTWVWDLGDGRVLTTQVNTLLLKYPAPTPLAERTWPLKVTLKSGTTDYAIARAEVRMGAPIYTAWKITSKTTEVFPDQRGVDGGLAWAGFVGNHGPATVWEATWNTYRADSAFYYTGQSANSAVALVVRDTLLGAPFPPQTGFLKSLYWWTYGSYPTSAATPLSAGLKGSSNTLVRGGTSCDTRYDPYFSMSGTTTAGRVTGLNWVITIPEINGIANEPSVLFEYDVTFAGDIATGTTTRLYRIKFDCFGAPDVVWGYRTTFTAERVR